jgi:putative glutamine amidotransferase
VLIGGSYAWTVARPVIGICAAVEHARWSVWDAEALLSPRGYVDAVQRAGGLAVLLVPDSRALQDPDETLDLVDGLILAGGTDIDPSAYGAPRHEETRTTSPKRDRFELALAARAMERDLPLLGVCRGMQLMNVARGGTLDQHLPESHGHHEHRRATGTFDGADHDVRLAEGSLAARSARETLHATKSHHHQGVDRIGEGFEVTGWSVLDDLPEAIELPDRRYVLAVQWHPEADEASPVIASLVQEARARRDEARAPGPAAPVSSP